MPISRGLISTASASYLTLVIFSNMSHAENLVGQVQEGIEETIQKEGNSNDDKPKSLKSENLDPQKIQKLYGIFVKTREDNLRLGSENNAPPIIYPKDNLPILRQEDSSLENFKDFTRYDFRLGADSRLRVGYIGGSKFGPKGYIPFGARYTLSDDETPFNIRIAPLKSLGGSMTLDFHF